MPQVIGILQFKATRTRSCPGNRWAPRRKLQTANQAFSMRRKASAEPSAQIIGSQLIVAALNALEKSRAFAAGTDPAAVTVVPNRSGASVGNFAAIGMR